MPGTELIEYRRRETAFITGLSPTMVATINRATMLASSGDTAGARKIAAAQSDALWRDVIYAGIAEAQATRAASAFLTGSPLDLTGAKGSARLIVFPLQRIKALAQLASMLTTYARIGTPPKLLAAQKAKLFSEARQLLGEAQQLLPLLREPVTRRVALTTLAYGYATARGFTNAKRLNAAIAAPSDRLYSLCAIAEGLLETGDYGGAKGAAQKAEAIDASLQENKSRSYERRILFKVLTTTGDLFHAYTLAHRMTELPDRAYSLANLATALAKAGGKAEAKRLIAEARQVWAGTNAITNTYEQDQTREYLVYALLALPDLAGAQKTAGEIFDPSMRGRAEKAINAAR